MAKLPSLLIVDDTPENLSLLDAFLKKLKINLISALSGSEALEKTQGIELALAIIDVHMPGMSGYELALKLIEERSGMKVPIIFITASHVNDMQVFEGYGSGAVDYILKPINRHILICKINVFLDLYNQRQKIIRDAALLRRSANKLARINAILEKRQEIYRTVADYTNDWEFWLGKNGTFRYCSPSCERVTGYTAAQFLQKPALFYEIIHPEDRAAFQWHGQKENRNQEASPELEYRIIRFDGAVRWIGHVCQPVYTESGDFIGTRGSNRDITERKKTEKLLITSEQKYKLLSENITDGVFICRNGRFEYANKAMSRIFLYEDRELEGMKLTELVMPDYLVEAGNFLTVNTPYSQVRNLEIECIRKDLSIVFVEFLFNYVASEKLVYGVAHDTTEKKQIQSNFIKAIIQTEEKERAYFSKELHDGLGPLLSTIKLYLQWSQRPKSNTSKEEILHKAEAIIEDALTTVKEISGKLSPHLLTYYGLTSAIQSFVDKLKETEAISIELQSNSERRLDLVIESALYRAIIECVNNTIKHARANNVYIILKDTGNQIHLQYRDDGSGFDIQEILSSQKGLGLFNLRNRIQTIGGKITMSSKPGQGVDYKIVVKV